MNAVLRFRARGICSHRASGIVKPDGEPIYAVLEFLTVGIDYTAFLSGSVKGGGLLRCSVACQKIFNECKHCTVIFFTKRVFTLFKKICDIIDSSFMPIYLSIFTSKNRSSDTVPRSLQNNLPPRGRFAAPIRAKRPCPH